MPDGGPRSGYIQVDISRASALQIVAKNRERGVPRMWQSRLWEVDSHAIHCRKSTYQKISRGMGWQQGPHFSKLLLLEFWIDAAEEPAGSAAKSFVSVVEAVPSDDLFCHTGSVDSGASLSLFAKTVDNY